MCVCVHIYILLFYRTGCFYVPIFILLFLMRRFCCLLFSLRSLFSLYHSLFLPHSVMTKISLILNSFTDLCDSLSRRTSSTFENKCDRHHKTRHISACRDSRSRWVTSARATVVSLSAPVQISSCAWRTSCAAASRS